MPLSIKIMKKIGGRSEMIASRSWPQNRISIGRGEECTLVLEDPKKHVSRVHVELSEKDDGSFQLGVVSKVNPVYVNGRRLAPGSQSQLGAGDRFELGEYEIEILPPPGSGPRVESPVSDVEETTRPNNPLLQVMRNVAPADAPTLLGVPARPEKTEPVPTVEAAEPPIEIDHGSLPPVEPGLFDDPAPEAPPPPAPVAAKPVAPAPAAPPPPKAAPQPAAPREDADVFAEATFVGQSPSSTSANLFDEATYVGRPGGAPAGAAAPAPVPGKELRAAVQAFLSGAGLEGKEIPDAELEAFLAQSGRVLRAAVEGSMALLAARATAKKELRAEDRTMVASRDNNPLKLMADPQEALNFLFDTKDRTGGFLDPVQAVTDAFDDLRAHEVALFAGMRAALLGAIQKFDPKTLETELEKNAGGLGLNRKARLWEQFAAFQQKLARDAEDDFNKVFGKEFMGTYMAQVKRLKSGGG